MWGFLVPQFLYSLGGVKGGEKGREEEEDDQKKVKSKPTQIHFYQATPKGMCLYLFQT